MKYSYCMIDLLLTLFLQVLQAAWSKSSLGYICSLPASGLNCSCTCHKPAVEPIKQLFVRANHLHWIHIYQLKASLGGFLWSRRDCRENNGAAVCARCHRACMRFVTRGTELYFFFFHFLHLKKGHFNFFKHLKEEPLAAKTLHGFAIRGHGARFAGCGAKIKQHHHSLPTQKRSNGHKTKSSSSERKSKRTTWSLGWDSTGCGGGGEEWNQAGVTVSPVTHEKQDKADEREVRGWCGWRRLTVWCQLVVRISGMQKPGCSLAEGWTLLESLEDTLLCFSSH